MNSKQQDYTEYTVDLSKLTKERPLGVTGILRCQNSADFLDACIESCIEGLDELIAVYHKCTDGTANILKSKESKYPNKIKIFEYQPYIYPIDIADEQFQETMNLPKERFISLEKIKKCNYSKLKRRKNLFICSRFERMFSYFYSAQRHSIPWRTLDNWRQEKFQGKASSQDLEKYKIEFDTIIQEYEVRDTLILMLGNHSIKNALFVYILSFILKEQMDYERSRIAGKSIKESIHNTSNFLNHFEWIEKKRNTTNNFNIDSHPWTKLLSPYKRCCLVYLTDEKELAHVSTFLQGKEIPILLLSEYEIPDDTELSGTVTAVQVEFSEQKVFENDSIEQNFPRLFLYANTFETILRILNPNKIVCLTSSKTYQK